MPLSQSTQDALATQRLYTNDEDQRKAIDELLAEQAALEGKIEEIRQGQVAASQTLEEARALVASVDVRKDECDEREAELGRVNESLTAEKSSFEQVRQSVDAQQAEKAADLQQREDTLAAREGELTRREAAVSDREESAKNQLALYGIAHTNLRAALDTNRVLLPQPVISDTPVIVSPTVDEVAALYEEPATLVEPEPEPVVEEPGDEHEGND